MSDPTARRPLYTTSALLSSDSRYRWWLRRRWAKGTEIGWIMLNPSTADANQDDPTIRRCVAFSKAWGHGGMVVVNLFATRATDPQALRLRTDFYQDEHEALIGYKNDAVIESELKNCAVIVAAWGNHGALYNRGAEVRELLGDYRLQCLGLTKTLEPRHPLYARADTALVPLTATVAA